MTRGEDDSSDSGELSSKLGAQLKAADQSIAELREYCDRLLHHQSQLDQRLLRVEHNNLFRIWNTVAMRGLQSYRKLGQHLLRSPIYPLVAKLGGIREAQKDAYAQWVCLEQAQLPSVEACRAMSAKWRIRPIISIIMPVYQPRLEWLEAAIRSVEAQCYTEWELCIVLDGAGDTRVMTFLESYTKHDQLRISELRNTSGIAAASNAAARLATGSYLAFLDHDDCLSPYALHYIVEKLQESSADLIYSDQDRLDANDQRVQPIFKPDWSPELLYGCMYVGHLLVVSTELFRAVGGFRSDFDGAQDHDLVLRLTDRPLTIQHIPRVLYHWRIHPGSTSAHSNAKPDAQDAGRRAVEEAVGRREGVAVQIEHAATPHTYTVLRRPADHPVAVTVIICSRSTSLISECVRSVRRAAGGSCEFIVVHHEPQGPDQKMRDTLVHLKCKVIRYIDRFNFSAMNNAAAAEARTPHLLFVNDDIIATGNRWWSDLTTQLRRPVVGVVGATLRYPSGAIQHAGIVLGLGDGVGHAGRYQYQSDLWPWLNLTRNVSAVTGACLGIRAEVFRELGGFDTKFPNNYNDVDLCLRAAARGYQIICIAGTDDLIHKECQTRMGVTSLNERDLFVRRWSHLLNRPDPLYSPALALTEQIALNV